MEISESENSKSKLLYEARYRIKSRYSGLGYKPCPLCDTPIRPVIHMSPGGRIYEKGPIEVHLRKMCEVCWRELSEIETYTINRKDLHEMEASDV